MKRIMKLITFICVVMFLTGAMSVAVLGSDTIRIGDGTDGYSNVEILFDEPFDNKDIVLALYGGGKLLDAKILEDITLTGNRLLAKVGSLNEADNVNAYVFTSIDTLKPCQNTVSVPVDSQRIMPSIDSYLHVDVPNMGYSFDSGKFSMPGGWISYNKDLGNVSDGKQVCIISDESQDDYKALFRDFDKIDSGRILLEINCSIASKDDGVYIGFSDGDNAYACGITTDYGYLSLKGTQKLCTGIAVNADKLNDYVIILDVNLDDNSMSACINGIYTDRVSISDNIALSRLIIGSTISGTGYLLPTHVRMYQNYAVAEHFLIPDRMKNKAPYSMNISGDIEVCEYPTVYQEDTYSALITAKKNTDSFAATYFDAVLDKGIFETYILLPDGSTGAYFSIKNGNNDVVKITSDNGAWYVGDKKMRDFTANVWQVLRIETNADEAKAVIKICGKTVGEVSICADRIDGIEIGISPLEDTVMWFDDITAYSYTEHADYPSEPVVNNDDGYNIGINVCNLWHDTLSGEGWQAVSPFEDLEPWLGYYDEGSPELSDWEIKIMAEHGIDFQNFCWYSPQYIVTNPIKTNKKVGPAIHDGYFNAKYSDKVKFSIMWDNTVSPRSSIDNFKKYIWSYWKEYYFSDTRYMTLDNMPVLTIWSYNSFCEMFGGQQEAAKVVSFMKEDIKSLGYDGLVLLTRTELGVNIGADATFIYHFSRDGNDAGYQIDSLEAEKDAALYVIPTLSMGHNDIGRNNVRSSLISLEEHKAVAEYIKNDYLDSIDSGTWKDNTLFVSTWNEYSEGHYISPSGEFGYGYLETVKDVFTNDESDHTYVDVIPTDAQKERITKLYSDTYQPIRNLMYTDSLEGEEYTPIALWDFSDSNTISKWSLNNIEKVEKTDNGIVLKGTSIDPQMYLNNVNIDISDKPVIHIRMRTAERNPENKEHFVSPYIYLFFSTVENPGIEGKTKVATCELSKDGKMTDYYIDMSSNESWTGTLNKLRFDPVENTLPFEIELVEFLVNTSYAEKAIATWDFSKETDAANWKFSNIEIESRNQNGIKCHAVAPEKPSAVSDPQMYLYNQKIDLFEKPSIVIRMRTSSDSQLYLFYATHNDPSVEGVVKYKRISVNATDEFVDYYIDMSKEEKWNGLLKTLRIDPVEHTDTFEIEYIKLVVPGKDEAEIYANGNRMTFDFGIYSNGYDVSVTTNPDLGFFTMLNLYHTWNRRTGILYVESEDHSLQIEIGKERAILDGKTVHLGYKPELRDGLPVIRIKSFCKMLGYDVTCRDGVININTGKTPINLEKNDYFGWDFDVNGNNENWYSYDSVLYAYDGCLNVKNTDYPDMHIFIKNIKIDASQYKRLAVGVRMNPEDAKGKAFQLYYKSGSQSLSEDKSFKHFYNTELMKLDETYEFVIDLSDNVSWNYIVDYLRVDVWHGDSDCSIDYIRFLP